jgi:hypothetical protein
MGVVEELAQANDEYLATVIEEEAKGEWRPAFADGTHTVAINAARIQSPPWEDERTFLYIEFSDGAKKDNHYMALTDLKGGQLGFLKKQLLGLGHTGDLVSLADGNDMVGNRVEIGVATTEYKGKKRQNYYFRKVVSSEVTGAADDSYPF